MHFEAPVSEWHLMVVGSRRLAIIDNLPRYSRHPANDGEHSARDILRTSAEAASDISSAPSRRACCTPVAGFAYGNDEVMRRFVSSCRNRARFPHA